MIYYKFCGSPTHTTKQCHALDALADRLDRYVFRVDEAPQGFGGGHRCREGFIGGLTHRIRPIYCYNNDEQGHLARDRPLPRRPRCTHHRNNAHATEECPKLITKWEERARQRGTNLINYEPRPITEEQEPNINIITRGKTRTGVDVDNPNQSKIQKEVSVDTKYDPIR